MMKKMIFGVMLTMMLMCVTSVSAQWSVTPEAGITAIKRNSFTNDSWRAGWKVGVGLEYQFTPRFFSMKTGLYYTQRGYSEQYFYYRNNMTSPGVPSQTTTEWYSGSVNRHFLQVPILANFSFDLGKDIRLNVGVGPYFAVSLADRTESYIMDSNYGMYPYYGGYYGNGYYGGYYGNYYGGYYNSGYNRRDLRPFDWGVNANIGLEVKQWVVNLGYEVSLGQEYTGETIQANYHSLSLSLGYKFKLGK